MDMPNIDAAKRKSDDRVGLGQGCSSVASPVYVDVEDARGVGASMHKGDYNGHDSKQMKTPRTQYSLKYSCSLFQSESSRGKGGWEDEEVFGASSDDERTPVSSLSNLSNTMTLEFDLSARGSLPKDENATCVDFETDQHRREPVLVFVDDSDDTSDDSDGVGPEEKESHIGVEGGPAPTRALTLALLIILFFSSGSILVSFIVLFVGTQGYRFDMLSSVGILLCGLPSFLICVWSWKKFWHGLVGRHVSLNGDEVIPPPRKTGLDAQQTPSNV